MDIAQHHSSSSLSSINPAFNRIRVLIAHTSVFLHLVFITRQHLSGGILVEEIRLTFYLCPQKQVENENYWTWLELRTFQDMCSGWVQLHAGEQMLKWLALSPTSRTFAVTFTALECVAIYIPESIYQCTASNHWVETQNKVRHVLPNMFKMGKYCGWERRGVICREKNYSKIWGNLHAI